MPKFNLFSWLGKQALKVPFVSFISNRLSGFFGFASGQEYLKEYRNWVFSSVTARSEEVGNIQLRLFRGEEELHEHPLLDLLHKVNPTMTQDELFAGTQAFKDLTGDSFWFLARDGNGKGTIKELWLLRPDKVAVAVGKNPLLVEGYTFTQPDGKKIPFAPNQILHHKTFNPLGYHPFPHRGMSIVQAAAWAIETDNEARKWNLKFFKNSARPDGFLVKEGVGTVSPDEHKRIKEQWSQEHEGSDNAHKVGILSGGLKWQDVTRSQKDMDFIEQRRFSRDEILALFKVPKSVIGITEDVNRANAEAANFVFADRTIKPLMQKLVNTLNEFLVPEFGEDLHLEFVSPVPEDRTQIVNEYFNGIDKWLSRNEIRAREGLPPTKNGDKFFGPLAFVPIDSVVEEEQRTSAKPPKEKEKEKEKTGDKVKDAIDKFVSKLPTVKEEEPKQLSELAIKNYIELWNKAMEVATEPLKEALIKYFKEQQKEVLENLKEELKGLESKEFKLKQVDDFLFSEAEALETGISLINPFLEQYILESGGQATLLTGVPEAFNPTSPAAIAFREERATFFAESINEVTREGLTDTLEAGLAADEGIDALSERVANVYGQAIDFRAERIARTEVSAASNFGAQEAYKQAGVEKHKWVVVSPDDSDCIENTNTEVKIGDAFPSGHTAPPVHPNCVCTTIPVFK